MTYEVKTAVFEGPLDLLLQLITRRQLEITNLSLADLVLEYLSFLDDMRELDLEVTSEFLLIASTLVQLKARHLLPDESAVDLDEELALMEERDRLLVRLLACVTFKDVAAVLTHRLQEANRYIPRSAGMDQAVSPRPPEVNIPVDALELVAIAARVLAAPNREPDLDHLDLELPSVEAAIHDLRSKIEDLAETSFDEIVSHTTRKVEVVAYFLALLELARWGLVEVAQRDWLSNIEVRRSGGAIPDDLTSEWSRTS
ncbi:MAG: segregation/condensation protein A [Acidimicrobiia bacterium]|nr:segregation/condensation protein A [Acidimicrobiia bacterium]MDH3396430.1 segregation/condensation protein A [Acidimicrobiia bacterium]